jgi:hypothetical protein
MTLKIFDVSSPYSFLHSHVCVFIDLESDSVRVALAAEHFVLGHSTFFHAHDKGPPTYAANRFTHPTFDEPLVG